MSVTDIEKYRKMSQDRADEEGKNMPPDGPDDTGGDGGPPLDFVRECYQGHHLGASELYSLLNKDVLVKDKTMKERDGWYHYVGPHWEKDFDGKSLYFVDKVVEQYMRLKPGLMELLKEARDDKNNDNIKKIESQIGKLNGKCEKLRDDYVRKAVRNCAVSNSSPLTIHPKKFDSKPTLLPVQNGVVNLETGELQEGDPSDYFTMVANVEWKGLNEPCPRWERYLSEILDDHQPTIEYLQRVLGYACSGLDVERFFIYLYGQYGQNGKGLMMEVLRHIMGDLFIPIESEFLMHQRYGKSGSGPSPEKLLFKGRRGIWASETEDGDRIAAGRIKLFTGGDEITGRGVLAKENTTFRPTHTMFVLSNLYAKAPAHDNAFWERIKVIIFPFTFVRDREPEKPHEKQADVGLRQELFEEAPGILAWCVRGFLKYRQMGLSPPRKVLDDSRNYRRKEDDMEDFIEQCCVVNPEVKCQSSIIYAKYKEWWETVSSKKPLSHKIFSELLELKFVKRKSNGYQTFFGVTVGLDGRKDGEGEKDEFTENN